jgi:hypothetical protein
MCFGLSGNGAVMSTPPPKRILIFRAVSIPRSRRRGGSGTASEWFCSTVTVAPGITAQYRDLRERRVDPIFGLAD